MHYNCRLHCVRIRAALVNYGLYMEGSAMGNTRYFYLFAILLCKSNLEFFRVGMEFCSCAAGLSVHDT